MHSYKNPRILIAHRILNRIFLWVFFASLFTMGWLTGCSSGAHFLTDRSYRRQVQSDFNEKRVMAVHREEALFLLMDQGHLPRKEHQALQFLYAYMPWADMAEYDAVFFLENVRHSFRVASSAPWGPDIPEEIFRHYVLPVRVNNENLDSSRWVFYRELAPRVMHLSMEEATLEVNRWCHEKVTYKASDGRTSSPLSTVQTAHGRCGEQSVFTVAALRSVGIPARQVYVPRWAHSDSNHAWVEVWINGEWKYLGACEPEPVLNRGWFTGPARRTMLVHSRVFGRYNGYEEVVSHEKEYAVINSTAIYAEVTHPVVTVVDENEDPVPDATVEFGLYNFAQFFPIASLTTNAKGECSITIGKGDILLHATDGNRCTWQHHNLRTDTAITLILKNCTLPTAADTWHFDVPNEVPSGLEKLPKEVIDEHRKLLAREDSIRNAYTATFPSKAEMKAFAEKSGKHVDSVVKYLQISQGNHQAVMQFIGANPYFYLLLQHLSDKDIRDTDFDRLYQLAAEAVPKLQPAPPIDGIIIHFYQETPWFQRFDTPETDDPFYHRYVLNPKIDLEWLQPYRKLLQEYFTPLFGTDCTPQHLFQWIRDSITVDTTPMYSRIITTPAGVHRLRVTDPLSRDIYFVAACRSMEIPARLDPATRTPQVYSENNWVDFHFDGAGTEAVATNGYLLIHPPEGDADPEYYTRFTVARLENGRFNTLHFPWGQPLSALPYPMELRPGYYALTSGLRQSTGDVDVVREYFSITPGETTSILFPVPEPEATVYGLWPGETTPAMEQGFLFLMPETTGEPSRHLLQELQNGFARDHENMPAVLLMWGDEHHSEQEVLLARYHLAGKVHVIPQDEQLKQALQEMLPTAAERAPLTAGVNANREIIFLAGGYQVNSIARIRELVGGL